MTTKRGDILRQAIAITESERNTQYGDPGVNMACWAELKAVYRKYAGDKYSTEHDQAIELALLKTARIATGSFHEDNYPDGASYYAMAGEAEGKKTAPSGCEWYPGKPLTCRCHAPKPPAPPTDYRNTTKRQS